tara:strand:+ start:511 stop:1767 length:1257 start_codon:yes stop_codon:yes gene_type:complete
MAWGDTSGQRGAAQKWTSENVPNYSGTAYGMNQGSSFYDPDMFNRTPEMGWSNMAGSEPYATPSQGYDRAGSARGDLGGSNYRNIELANRRGIGSIPDEDEGMGMVGHAKQALSGFKWPSFRMADSIVKNQKQHRDLDKYFQSTYGDDWRKAKNASFWQGQGFGSASKNQDMSLLSPQGRRAHGYFTRAGITDNDLDAFMNPKSKWFGNEAYLKSVAGAEGAEAFKQGMSFIKNAADTSDLHGRMMRGPIQDASERSMELGIGITGRPDWDTFDSEMVEPGIPGRPAWDTFDSEMEPGIPGRPAWDTFDEDITNDIDFRSGIGQEGGYTEISRPPGGYLDVRDTLSQQPSFWEAPFEYGPFYSSPFDFNFKPEGWDQEYSGQDLEFLLNPEDYYEDLRENEEEIIPNISDLDYFNQFK